MKHIIINIAILFLGVVLVPSSVISQNKKERLRIAHEHVTTLQSSDLLVRLKTKNNTIKALRENNHHELADIVEQEMKDKNKAIVSAFNDHFTFCPVYFFYSTESKFIRENNLDSLHFLNKDLEIDNTIKPDLSTFYIAEFGNIEQHPSHVKTGKYDVYDAEGEISTRDTYTGQTDFGFGALVMKDSNFNQLARPFPYYSRTYEDIIFVKRKPSTVVKKMNDQLLEFLNSPH